MHAAPAELARTLASGHLPALVHVAWSETVWRVPAALDAHANPLLLVPDDGLDAALTNSGGGLDAAVALRFDDEPPLPCAPGLGSAWVCGWAEPVPATRRREAAVRFAETNPLPQLLDVGSGWALWRVDVAEIRLEHGGGVAEIPVEDYACAESDPLYPLEVELLLDLYDHHPEVLEALAHRIGHSVPATRQVVPLRMNRHGVLVDVHCSDRADPRRFLVRHRHEITDLTRVLPSLCHCDCPKEARAA